MEKYYEKIWIFYYGCMLFKDDEKLKDIPKDCIYDDGSMKQVVVHLPGALIIYKHNESLKIEDIDISGKEDEIIKLELLTGKNLNYSMLTGLYRWRELFFSM